MGLNFRDNRPKFKNEKKKDVPAEGSARQVIDNSNSEEGKNLR
jgi:hypothetical protein